MIFSGTLTLDKNKMRNNLCLAYGLSPFTMVQCRNTGEVYFSNVQLSEFFDGHKHLQYMQNEIDNKKNSVHSKKRPRISEKGDDQDEELTQVDPEGDDRDQLEEMEDNFEDDQNSLSDICNKYMFC